MENIKPKFEVGTKIIYKQKKYNIADYVYYKSTDSWYYWLRGITRKSSLGKPEWIYTLDAKQILINRIDSDNSIKIISETA